MRVRKEKSHTFLRTTNEKKLGPSQWIGLIKKKKHDWIITTGASANCACDCTVLLRSPWYCTTSPWYCTTSPWYFSLVLYHHIRPSAGHVYMHISTTSDHFSMKTIGELKNDSQPIPISVGLLIAFEWPIGSYWSTTFNKSLGQSYERKRRVVSQSSWDQFEASYRTHASWCFIQDWLVALRKNSEEGISKISSTIIKIA